MNVNTLDLAQASQVYAVANTPLFLVRKLQADPSIRSVADTFSGEEIVEGLRSILDAEPTTTNEAVRPYALLIALWFKPEIEHLQMAAGLQSEIYSWYEYIARALLSTFSPVKGGLIEVPTQFTAPSASNESTAPVERRILLVG